MVVSVILYRLLLYFMHLNHAAESLQHACASSRTCLPDSSFVSLAPTNGCMCFSSVFCLVQDLFCFCLFCYPDLLCSLVQSSHALSPLEVCPDSELWSWYGLSFLGK